MAWERPSLSAPLGAVDGREDAAQGGQVNVMGDAHAPVLPAVPLVLEQDVGHAWESEPSVMAWDL